MDIKGSFEEGFNLGKTCGLVGLGLGAIALGIPKLIKKEPSYFISAGMYCGNFTVAYAVGKIAREEMNEIEHVYVLSFSFFMTTFLTPLVAKRFIKNPVGCIRSGLYACVFTVISWEKLENTHRKALDILKKYFTNND